MRLNEVSPGKFEFKRAIVSEAEKAVYRRAGK
jgi:hypothetical protein